MIDQDTIVSMAREAGMSSLSLIDIGYLEKFAALVAAAEREACAEECENQKVGLPSYFEIDERIQWCADAIRARGNA